MKRSKLGFNTMSFSIGMIFSATVLASAVYLSTSFLEKGRLVSTVSYLESVRISLDSFGARQNGYSVFSPRTTLAARNAAMSQYVAMGVVPDKYFDDTLTTSGRVRSPIGNELWIEGWQPAAYAGCTSSIECMQGYQIGLKYLTEAQCFDILPLAIRLFGERLAGVTSEVTYSTNRTTVEAGTVASSGMIGPQFAQGQLPAERSDYAQLCMRWPAGDARADNTYYSISFLF
jgi:hypothetical protein